jgi:hypothetical protein
MYVAVIVTSIEGIVTVAMARCGLSRMAVSPLQPANLSPFGASPARTLTNVPAKCRPLALPWFTVNKWLPGGLYLLGVVPI